MSNITVEMEVLEGKIAHFKSISSRVNHIENKLSIIRRNIDNDVKYRQNIDGGLRQLCRQIGDLEQDIYKAGTIINEAIRAYADIEKKLKSSFNELNRESKSNVIEIVDEVPFIIGKKITPTFKRIWSIFHEIQSILTSSIDHLKQFFDEKGITKRADSIIHEEPIIDLEEDNKLSIPPLEGILSKNIDIYNEDVKIMQQRLNELGYTDANGKPLAEDGYFGNKTLEAVNTFKEDNQLWNFGEYTGKVGETTWEYLFVKAKPHENQSRKDETNKVSWEKVEGVTVWDEPQTFPVYIRSDLEDSFYDAVKQVNDLGGLIVSSGGKRALSDIGRPGTSKTSLHYTGRAVDLFAYGGMQNAETDLYIVVRTGGTDENPIWTVYTKTENENVDEITLNAAIFKKGKGITEKEVTGKFINVTEILSAHGWENISARSGWKNNYMNTEWWHFQNEDGLEINETTFRSQLEKLYSKETIDEYFTGDRKKYLDYEWNGGYFSN